MKVSPLIFALALVGCADWPSVDTPKSQLAWPSLVPLSSISVPGETVSEVEANDLLLSRAAALRARAALMRRPVSGDDAAIERLRGRLAR